VPEEARRRLGERKEMSKTEFLITSPRIPESEIRMFDPFPRMVLGSMGLCSASKRSFGVVGWQKYWAGPPILRVVWGAKETFFRNSTIYYSTNPSKSPFDKGDFNKFIL